MCEEEGGNEGMVRRMFYGKGVIVRMLGFGIECTGICMM